MTNETKIRLNGFFILRLQKPQILCYNAQNSLREAFIMIFNDEKLIRLLKNAPNGSEMKVFFYIAANQPKTGIEGFRTTKIQLAVDLNLKRTAIFDAIRWLKSEILIQEIKQVEDSDFMVNPYFVMNDCDFETRKAEWVRRCRLDIQREVRLAKERRFREFRNAKKQNK